MEGDGNGWAAAPHGKRVWGRYGAAGLFLVATQPETAHGPEVLLQHRALWTASGGKWALPGGARDSHETAYDTAVRESVEETAVDPDLVDLRHAEVTAGPFPADPERPELAGGWSYTTVLAVTATGGRVPVTHNDEALELRWVALADLGHLDLLPAFAAAVPRLRTLTGEHLGSSR